MDNQDSVIDRVSYIVVHSYRYDTYYHYQGIEDTVVEEDFLLMKKELVLRKKD